MNIKRTAISALLITVISVNPALASILGSLKESSSLPIGQGLNLYQNTFLSEQTGVGNQTEYYSEYTPNSDVVPVVLTGEDIYGKRNANEIIDYMKEKEMVPMLGINASFFSFQTGIPMGHVITDGIVTSKDNRTLAGIGFRADGTAFIDDMYIETNAQFGEDYMLQIPHINKYISQETQMLTLYTPDFGEYTGTSTETLNVILENITDNVRVGGTFTCTVKEIFKSGEPVKINEGEFVLSVNTNGNQWAITLINTMYPGEEITIKTTANNDEWINAYNGLASEGERLLTNGVMASNLPAGADPRTAVGITQEGKIIFYVIDGRQNGYSYGVRKDTLAKRLQELGCVDAINLDGGGSTTMSGVFPGCDTSAIINSPSEGGLRKVTNFIFLKNVSQAVGKPEMAYIYPYSGNVLSGSTINLSVKTVDENYFATETGVVTYTCNEYASVGENGELTVLGEGNVSVNASVDGLNASASFKSYITPDEVKLLNAQNGAELDVIDVLPGDKIYLKAESYYDGKKLISSNDAYRWELQENSNVSFDFENGILEIKPEFEQDTSLTLKAGALRKNYLIRLGQSYKDTESYPYSEIRIDNDTLIIDMYSYNDKISKTKSYIKLDGQKIALENCEITDVDDKHINIKYHLGDRNIYHKVYCETVLNNGYSSVNTFKISDSEFDNIFADTQNHWAKNIIAYMNKMGVVNGSDENGTVVYRPNDSVTRAEFAIMICNYLGLNVDDYSDISLASFVDEQDIPKWAFGHVQAAYANKIINGKENDGLLYFDPTAKITRAEAVTIISRVLPAKLLVKNVDYRDNSDIPAWANHAVKVLSTAGLLNGYEDNTIRPQNSVTRAEAVTMIYNIY